MSRTGASVESGGAESFRWGQLATFLPVWGGQSLSAIGSRTTLFALSIWVFQETGSATLFSLVLVIASLPAATAAPFAGALADRWNRRTALLVANGVAAVSVGALGLHFVLGDPGLWEIYLLLGVAEICEVLKTAAYSAATTQMVPRPALDRANGFLQSGDAMARIAGPFLGGLLVGSAWGVRGALALDVLTYVVGLLSLLPLAIPDPDERVAIGFWRDTLERLHEGWRWVTSRRSLVGLLGFFAVTNVAMSGWEASLSPLLLTLSSPEAMGSFFAIAATAMLVGSVAVIARGAPRRRMVGIFGGSLVIGLGFLVAGLVPDYGVMLVATSLAFLAAPVALASNRLLWQTKTPVGLQGRIFATYKMCAQIGLPLGFLVGGAGAEHVAVPAFQSDGVLAGWLGGVFGTGEISGYAFMVALFGLVVLIATGVCLSLPGVRGLDRDLEDAV